MAHPAIVATQRADTMAAFKVETERLAALLGIDPPAAPATPSKDPLHRSVQELQSLLAFVKAVRQELIPDESTAESGESVQVPQDAPADLAALSAAILKDRAKVAGVKGYGSMSKPELVKALTEPVVAQQV